MVVNVKPDEGDNDSIPRSPPVGKISWAEDLVLNESPSLQESPDSTSTNKHVVIVMDAMKEFSIETLQWTLDHVIGSGYILTLLGVMPWLNLPLSCKTWLDVWTVDLGDLSALREKSELKTDLKYQKVQAIIDLCHKYGVVPNMKVAMGYPLRLVVLEQTTSLHATWVVFDRHHRKNRAFYSKRIPCNIVMMNNEGEVDMLKMRQMIHSGDTTPGESPASCAIVPKVIISKKLMGILKPKEQEKNDEP